MTALPRLIQRCLGRLSYGGPFQPVFRRALHAVLPATLCAAERRGICRIIGFMLGESEQRSGEIMRQFLYHRAVSAKRWSDVMTRRVPVDAVTRTVALEDEQALTSFLQCRGRGLVVTTFHGGDYLSALLRLSEIMPAGRCVHVLRRRDARTRDANRALPTLLPNLRVVLDDGAGLRAAVRALRRGDVLIVLCDLPPSWGAAAPVTLFGQPAVWTRSPADFATLGRADLLPLTTRLTDRGDCVATPHALLSAERLAGVTPMHRLAQIAERQIRAAPGQWHQWPLVPEMLRPHSQARPLVGVSQGE
jgi:phosphatidylinositol dimannoside acyltransferase